MKKTIFFLLVCLCSVVNAGAENVDALVVHLNSGEQITCVFTEKPRVTYDQSNVVITTTSTEMRYAMSDVYKLDYAKLEASAVNAVTTPSATVKVLAGEIVCSGLPAASPVSVYTTDGRLVASVKADTSGTATVSLPTKGCVYIVRTATASFKIVNR